MKRSKNLWGIRVNLLFICGFNNIKQFKCLRASSPDKFSGSREAPAPSRRRRSFHAHTGKGGSCK